MEPGTSIINVLKYRVEYVPGVRDAHAGTWNTAPGTSIIIVPRYRVDYVPETFQVSTQVKIISKSYYHDQVREAQLFFAGSERAKFQ